MSRSSSAVLPIRTGLETQVATPAMITAGRARHPWTNDDGSLGQEAEGTWRFAMIRGGSREIRAIRLGSRRRREPPQPSPDDDRESRPPALRPRSRQGAWVDGPLGGRVSVPVVQPAGDQQVA